MKNTCTVVNHGLSVAMCVTPFEVDCYKNVICLIGMDGE
jgi:hypothetical protein